MLSSEAPKEKSATAPDRPGPGKDDGHEAVEEGQQQSKLYRVSYDLFLSPRLTYHESALSIPIHVKSLRNGDIATHVDLHRITLVQTNGTLDAKYLTRIDSHDTYQPHLLHPRAVAR